MVVWFSLVTTAIISMHNLRAAVLVDRVDPTVLTACVLTIIFISYFKNYSYYLFDWRVSILNADALAAIHGCPLSIRSFLNYD